MDLFGPGVAQELNNLAARCTADYRVINHDDRLTRHQTTVGIELQPHRVEALLLRRLDKSPSNIFILCQSFEERNSLFKTIANGGRRPLNQERK